MSNIYDDIAKVTGVDRNDVKQVLLVLGYAGGSSSPDHGRDRAIAVLRDNCNDMITYINQSTYQRWPFAHTITPPVDATWVMGLLRLCSAVFKAQDDCDANVDPPTNPPCSPPAATLD